MSADVDALMALGGGEGIAKLAGGGGLSSSSSATSGPATSGAKVFNIGGGSASMGQNPLILGLAGVAALIVFALLRKKKVI